MYVQIIIEPHCSAWKRCAGEERSPIPRALRFIIIPADYFVTCIVRLSRWVGVWSTQK